jgi:hypothetical protein
MATRKKQIPVQQFRAEFVAESFNEKEKTVDVIWTTGAKVRRYPWFDEAFDEELSLDPKHVRMEFLGSGKAPLLDVHNRYQLQDVLGVIASADLEAGKRGVAKIRFSQRASIADIVQDVKDGIITGVSVGYRVHKYEKQPKGADEAVPVYRAIDWEPFEISLVPIGADKGATVRSDNRTNDCLLINDIAIERGEEENTMKVGLEKKEQESSVVQPVATPAPAVAADQARKEGETEGAKNEQNRSSEILAMVRKFKLPIEFGEELIKGGKSLDACRAAVMDKLAGDEAPATRTANPVIVGGQDSVEKFRDGASDWLLQRSGSAVVGAVEKQSGKKLEAGEFRGLSLIDIARESLVRAGVNVRGMDKMTLVGRALTHTRGMQSTSDFGILLENALNKVLLASYAITPDTWSRFCKKGSVSDFRAHPRYRRGFLGRLDKVGQNGEFKNKALPDGTKESITAGTVGNILSLTRQTIINDDMGIFSDVAMQLGRAGKLSVEVDVYELLTSNAGLGPVMSNGKTLFHADHKNIGAQTALGVAGIDVDRVVLAEQKDPANNEILDLKPAVLLVPTGLGGDARVINEAQYDVDTANKLQKPNKVRGLFRDIVDTARLTGTRRYLFADPTVAPVIEVAFLDGQENPFLESEHGFRIDGVEWKARLDYGTAGIDSRGGVTNAG